MVLHSRFFNVLGMCAGAGLCSSQALHCASFGDIPKSLCCRGRVTACCLEIGWRACMALCCWAASSALVPVGMTIDSARRRSRRGELKRLVALLHFLVWQQISR